MAQNQIQDLQDQIAKLQASLLQKPTVDLRQAVREVLAEQSVQAAPTPVPAKPMTVLEVIGSVMTEEEQKWFSNVDNLTGVMPFIPKFLNSEQGRAAIRSLIDAYRSSR